MVMTPNLLEMNRAGEKAFKFTSQSMNSGFEIIIGFFNDKARYVVFKKASGKPWEDADMRSGMLLIGRLPRWTPGRDIDGKPAADFVDYLEREGDTEKGAIVAEASGWQSPIRRYSFFYVPTLRGEVPIIPDKSSLDLKLTPTITASVNIIRPGRRSAGAPRGKAKPAPKPKRSK